MQKRELINLLDNIFKPFGFKRKGNYWSSESQDLIKIINLQKSSFGNCYYINYGFNLKDLHYDATIMHVFRGLTAQDNKGNSLLDFGHELNPEYRSGQINRILQTVLLKELQEINSVSELIKDLSKRPHLNDVPLKVKEFLGIS